MFKKTLLVLCLFLSFSSSTFAVTFKSDFVDAIRIGKAQKKPVFVVFHADWCGWCHKLDNEVLNNVEVSKYIDANFVSVRLDTEESVGENLSKHYGVKGLPTMLFLNPENGKVLKKLTGYNSDITWILGGAQEALEKLQTK